MKTTETADQITSTFSNGATVTTNLQTGLTQAVVNGVTIATDHSVAELDMRTAHRDFCSAFTGPATCLPAPWADRLAGEPEED